MLPNKFNSSKSTTSSWNSENSPPAATTIATVSPPPPLISQSADSYPSPGRHSNTLTSWSIEQQDSPVLALLVQLVKLPPLVSAKEDLFQAHNVLSAQLIKSL